MSDHRQRSAPRVRAGLCTIHPCTCSTGLPELGYSPCGPSWMGCQPSEHDPIFHAACVETAPGPHPLPSKFAPHRPQRFTRGRRLRDRPFSGGNRWASNICGGSSRSVPCGAWATACQSLRTLMSVIRISASGWLAADRKRPVGRPDRRLDPLLPVARAGHSRKFLIETGQSRSPTHRRWSHIRRAPMPTTPATAADTLPDQTTTAAIASLGDRFGTGHGVSLPTTQSRSTSTTNRRTRWRPAKALRSCVGAN